MNKDYWNDYYLKTESEFIPWNSNGERIFRTFSKSLRLVDPILDVGCGSGYKMKYLKSLGKKVYGFDISEEAIRLAADEHAVMGDIQNIEDIFPDIRFHTIIDIFASQFVEDRTRYINHLYSHLSSGDQILLGNFIPPHQYGKSYDQILTEWGDLTLVEFRSFPKPVKPFNFYLFEKSSGFS